MAVLRELLDAPLDAEGDLSRRFLARGVAGFRAAARLVHGLPYGRATDVLAAGQGTCSSKHALLAGLAAECGVDAVLVLGLVRMDGPASVRTVLDDAGLSWMPEAHCWLRVEGRDWDLTFPDRRPGPPAVAVVESVAWSPERLGEKVAWHRARLAAHAPVGWTVDELWAVRERCIAALAASL
jgi:hypothetical protein